MRYLVSLIVLVLSTSTFAADVKTLPHNNDFPGVLSIVIEGAITEGDTIKLATVVSASSKRQLMVVISSAGGNAYEGLSMYRYLTGLHKSHEVHTIVPAQAQAASSAALIWLAGENRELMDNASILFHLPYQVADKGKPVARLSRIGVEYMTVIMDSLTNGEDIANLCLGAQQMHGSHVYVALFRNAENKQLAWLLYDEVAQTTEVIK